MAYNPLQAYLQEATELIADIEESALDLTTEDSHVETVNRLFRAFHTLKGSGAMCGLDSVSGFTHHLENLLEKVREGALPVSAPLTELILKATDHVRLMLDAARNNGCVPGQATHALVSAINSLVNNGTLPEDPDCQTNVATASKHEEAKERKWTIRFQPNRSLLATGGNPLMLLNDLRKLGPCEVVCHTDAVPLLDEIETEACYLWWTIQLRSDCAEEDIRDVFLFVEDDSTLEISDTAAEIVPSSTHATAEPETIPAAAPEQAASENQVAVSARKRATDEAMVRVPAERLDRLVNLIGELVMNHSSLAQAVARTGAQEFANPVQVLERLVSELRDNVLGIRMLTIGTLFGRFRRVVHDLSSELGKEADLVTEGAETELDKSILDQLGEPLVHCLRNCLDHGVEPVEERLRNGKPRRATIRLSAAHVGSNVVIRIEDDGRGIDREAVRLKAIEKQLISPDASLSDKDVLNLILLPGFSTARQVTSVSGRGVGMDAAKRQIDSLRGSLRLESTAGKVTRVSITLPLTLAIIDGLLVQIGRDHFIVPMAAVTENVELNVSERAHNNGRNLLAVRGELISYVDLRRVFRIEGEAPPVQKVIIVHHEGERVGLVVDRVIGNHQTVIQSLGRFFRDIQIFSGATIMGDGQVALIMDVAAMVRHADRQCDSEPVCV